MNFTLFDTLLAKQVDGATPCTQVEKLSKLFEQETVKKFMPTETTGLDNSLKTLDGIYDLSKKEEDAKKRDAMLHKLNKELLANVYVFGSKLSALDIVYFVMLHPWMAKLNDKERFIFCNITRWFDFVQNTSFNNNGEFNIIPINTTPPPPEPPKKAAPAAAKPAAAAVDGQAPKKGSGREKPVEAPKPQDVSRFEIRVGKIVDVKRHELADGLYVEQIDLGEAAPRTICSGLAKYIPIEQMANRMVLVLCNLKPRTLKGTKSEGMVLCGKNPTDDSIVELAEPPANAKIGERVSFAEFPGDFDKVLKDETLIKDVLGALITNADKIATYKNSVFTTSAGPYIETIVHSDLLLINNNETNERDERISNSEVRQYYENVFLKFVSEQALSVVLAGVLSPLVC
eukprot:gene8924-10456_t